jgi:hypothetical protein
MGRLNKTGACIGFELQVNGFALGVVVNTNQLFYLGL